MRTLVTGANGHVGFNLCKALLARGHTVRASIRSLADETKAAPLRALGGVEIVGVDVQREDQFLRAAEGIDVLYHVAATYAYVTGGKDKDAAMIRDSVRGTENALRSAALAKVEKVVMTSSAVALPLTPAGAAPVDESAWRTDLAVPYFRAKTEAEKNAWRLAEELEVKLVTVLPGAIGGPGFARRTPTTDIFEGIMLGTMRLAAPNGNFPYVDIRDVVGAHVLAGEKECAGRYIVCNDEQPSFLAMIRAMNRIDPKVRETRRMIPRFANGVVPLVDRLNAAVLKSPRVLTAELVASLGRGVWNIDCGRAKRDLGWTQAVPLEQSLADMMARIRELRAASTPA